jgi:hypothetical protein
MKLLKINISTRYWLLILILYLTTLKAVNVSHKDMKSENQMVSGFIGEDNEVLNPKPFNIKGFLYYLKGEKINILLRIWMLKETQF